MRSLHFLLAAVLAAVVLAILAPHPLPQDQRVDGAWGKPARIPPEHPDPKYITHPPVEVTCNKCTSSWGNWDICQSEASCKQTDSTVCTPLTAKDMHGNYTGCMCPWAVLSSLDAMSWVHIPDDEGVCKIGFCDTRVRICDDGCCRGRTGQEEACGRTMQWFAPKDPSNTSGNYQISVCVPANLTEAERRAQGVCFKDEPVGKDCAKPNWEPCCMGHDRVDSCQSECHTYLWQKYTEDCVAVLAIIPGLFLLMLLFDQAWFWRFLKWGLTRIDLRVALVIDYSEEGSLQTTTNGGKAVKDKFLEMGFHRVIRLSEEQATDPRINECIKTLIRYCGENRFQRSLIVVYFAGHGRFHMGSNQLRVHQSHWYDLKDAVRVFEKMHSSNALRELGLEGFRPVRSAHVLFLLDCCQTQEGSSDSPLRMPNSQHHQTPTSYFSLDALAQMGDTAAQIAYIYAAPLGEQTLDQLRIDDAHSPFTHILLDIMDMRINICQLFWKIEDGMSELSADLKVACRNVIDSNSSIGHIRLLGRRGDEESLQDEAPLLQAEDIDDQLHLSTESAGPSGRSLV